MKFLVFLGLVVVALARPEDTYDTKYDNFNVDEVIANDRLLKSFAHCFIGDGKCTPEGNDVKKYVPEAIASSCSKCSEKQKVLIAKAMKTVKTKLPAEYVTLKKQHDPENKHDAAIDEFFTKYAS